MGCQVIVKRAKKERKNFSRIVDPDPDPTFDVKIQGFDDHKIKKKNIADKFFLSFFVQRLQFTYP